MSDTMMVTFAITVPVDADLEAEELDLIARAELMLDSSGEDRGVIVVERSDSLEFVNTDETVLIGLEMQPRRELRRQILLEAKVEVQL
ncbi:hypothetical protein SEA_MARCIE_9 [Microbacterium phage Marcie]|nr:hypothetical protein SEA_MARCIE_9 [Microbacterium phage Marcie]